MNTQPTALRCVEKRKGMTNEREREIWGSIYDFRSQYSPASASDQFLRPLFDALEETLNALGTARNIDIRFDLAQMPAVDALRQWKHAEDTCDASELQNAIAARNAILARIKA